MESGAKAAKEYADGFDGWKCYVIIMAALVGYSGFVGSYLRTQLAECDLYNSKNIETLRGKQYNILYCCGLPATKWQANKFPAEDIAGILKLQNVLITCNIKKFVLISTIDVYDKAVLHQTEDVLHQTEEPYGQHRRFMEEWVMTNFDNYFILRLPALFGLGMKKNCFYDLMKGNAYCKFNPEDQYQWYYLDDLWGDIQFVVSNNIRVLNCFSAPIKMQQVLDYVFDDETYEKTDAVIKYNYRTQYSATTYFKDKNYILEKMKEFLTLWRFLHGEHRDKLVVSNLCWKPEHEDMALAVLRRYNISNVELALRRHIKSWDDNLCDVIEKYIGFNIYSLQAFFYGVNAGLFTQREEFIAHFKKIIDIARVLGVRVLVFGSPKNRKVPDNMCLSDADDIAVKVFKEISAAAGDVCVCIEHNAVEYGCNYINYVAEAVQLVEKIGRDNVKVNFDVGNAMMMNDSGDCDCMAIGHIQVAAPFLGALNEKVHLDSNIKDYYTGKISMEAKDLDDFEGSLRVFIESVASIYLPS